MRVRVLILHVNLRKQREAEDKKKLITYFFVKGLKKEEKRTTNSPSLLEFRTYFLNACDHFQECCAFSKNIAASFTCLPAQFSEFACITPSPFFPPFNIASKIKKNSNNFLFPTCFFCFCIHTSPFVFLQAVLFFFHIVPKFCICRFFFRPFFFFFYWVFSIQVTLRTLKGRGARRGGQQHRMLLLLWLFCFNHCKRPLSPQSM